MMSLDYLIRRIQIFYLKNKKNTERVKLELKF